MSYGWTLCVPLEWKRVSWGTSGVASRLSRTLSRLKSEGGISLEMQQRKRASSRIEGRHSWFLSICCSKLGVSLELRLGPQGPALGDLRNVQSPCEMPRDSRDSSAVASVAEVLTWS